MSTVTAESFFNQLLSELCIEISFRSVQKQLSINSVCPHCNTQCNFIHEKGGLDIYGNRIDSNGSVSASTSGLPPDSAPASTNNGILTVECPCCKKALAATRFAPHLEKCMGMGRQAARKRGNLTSTKASAGSDNDSADDGGVESVSRTPAGLSITEDSFPSNEAKKVKASPSKTGKSGGGGLPSATQSKSTSPSKAKRVTTPVKSKAGSSGAGSTNLRRTPAMPDQQLDSVAVKKATTLNEIEDQENSLIQQTHSKTALKGNNFDANNNGDKLGLLITPRAKNVLTNRRVLADKTPNNIKRPLQSTTTNSVSPTRSSSPSSLALKNVMTTPLQAHPSVRDIADSIKTLKNPPDLFLQPAQKRRSIRNRVVEPQPASNVVNTTTANSTKLTSVFPEASDELDLEEIEHASSALSTKNDDDSDYPLYGQSKIIPDLELHKNLDFSRLFKSPGDFEENNFNNEVDEKLLIIEPINVDFKVDNDEEEGENDIGTHDDE